MVLASNDTLDLQFDHRTAAKMWSSSYLTSEYFEKISIARAHQALMQEESCDRMEEVLVFETVLTSRPAAS